MRSDKPLRVSVIVPVFEPGPTFDDLIASLDRQTLTADEFEVILCDDGSGDATRARLAQVARSRRHVRVLTLPHTGWPGTPRNHGIDAAQGTYVFFSDQDDYLFENGLKALCDYADLHSSDVVVGKVVGVGRAIPGQIFRRDVPHAVLGADPLLQLLTPHKLFRTAFLRENAIRYPDGKVRLEDHLFVMRAYFAATTISILASTPCYAWAENSGSASSSRIDPVTYFPHLKSVLDLVEANTTPGQLRDTLLRHWYRGKILQRLEGRRVVRYPEGYRTTFLDVITPLAQRRFGAGVQDGLPLQLRIRSELLRSGRRDDLLRFAEFESSLECRAHVVAVRWTPSGKLALVLRLRFVLDGDEVALSDDANLWFPPASLPDEVLAPSARDAARDLRHDRVELFIREPSGIQRRIPGHTSAVSGSTHLTVEPLAAYGYRDAGTGGTLIVRVRHGGWTIDAPLHAPEDFDFPYRSPILAGRRAWLLRDEETVELRREWPGGPVRDFIARVTRRTRRIVRKKLRRIQTVK